MVIHREYRVIYSLQGPVFVAIWGNYCEDSRRLLERLRQFQTWSEAFRPFPKMTIMVSWNDPMISEDHRANIYTVYYETGFQKQSSLTFVAFWCRVSTACVPSTQFFSLKYFGSWGLNSNVPVAPLNGHFPWEIWVIGQVLCSLVSWSRSPWRNEDSHKRASSICRSHLQKWPLNIWGCKTHFRAGISTCLFFFGFLLTRQLQGLVVF